jgi:hypothetical protein
MGGVVLQGIVLGLEKPVVQYMGLALPDATVVLTIEDAH